MTLEILTIIVLVNIGATIELWRLWRRAARRPEKLKKESRLRHQTYHAQTPTTAPTQRGIRCWEERVAIL